MAAETYAYNLLGTDLASDEFAAQSLQERKVLWLSSKHPAAQVKQRLHENPLAHVEEPYCDLDEVVDFGERLIVGDIGTLNKYVESRGKALIPEEPDIVSGGPPCQSFSMAGLREYGNHRNRLPWEFAKFVQRHEAKLVVLENVSGILHPFSEDGRKIHAWFEVAKAFAKTGYAPICLHVNAVNVGVAQNRPRFLMFAVRGDLVDDVASRLGAEQALLDMGRGLLEDRHKDVDFNATRHRVVDLRKPGDAPGSESILHEFFCTESEPVTVAEAIDDLSLNGGMPSHYVSDLSKLLSSGLAKRQHGNAIGPQNIDHRQHSGRVKARFRLYQVLADVGLRNPDVVGNVLRNLRADSLEERSLHLPREDADVLLRAAKRWPGGILDEEENRISDARGVQELIRALRSRKHSQRALLADRPAPAALSIPDDACHYREVRTLSVREMARIQSFPDEFVFRSIPTTGGSRRAYQVPQYTQVGNAVPPKLGRAIGRFADFLLGGDRAALGIEPMGPHVGSV